MLENNFKLYPFWNKTILYIKTEVLPVHRIDRYVILLKTYTYKKLNLFINFIFH